MKPVRIAIDQLTLDPFNARKHDQRSIDAIADSFKQFGQQKPLVVCKSTVIAGNGGLLAARQLKWKEVWVTPFEDEAKARAYALADNRSAELSAWDAVMLTDSLAELSGAGQDLAALGFNAKDVQAFQKEAGSVEQTGASFQNQLNYKLTYELVFDSHEEQTKFYDAIRLLNKTRSEVTVAARLLAHLQATLTEKA